MSGTVDAADLRAEVEDLGEDAGRAFSDLVALDPREDFSGAVRLLERVCRALAPLVVRFRGVGFAEVARGFESWISEARALQEVPRVEDPEEKAERVNAYWEEVSSLVERVRSELVQALPAPVDAPRPFPELIAAYEATEYVVDPLGDGSVLFVLRVGQHSPDLERLLDDCRPPTVDWAVITAWNPRSALKSELWNAGAQRRLQRRLKGLGYRTWRAWGQGPSGWREESLFVHGLGVDDATWLAREFEQTAVLCGHRGAPAELVLCGPRPERG